VRVKLLTRVRSIKFRFMNASRTWVGRWPGSDAVGSADGERARPAAVEVVIDLEDWGQIRRVIEVAG
jgi:hypothetical protein